METLRPVGRCLTVRVLRNQENMSRPGRDRRRQHSVRAASSRWDRKSPAGRPSMANYPPSVRSGYSSLPWSLLVCVCPWCSYKDRIAYCACLRSLHPRRWPRLLREVRSAAASLPLARSSARVATARHRRPPRDIGERHQRQFRLWVDFESASSPSTRGLCRGMRAQGRTTPCEVGPAPHLRFYNMI